MTDATPETPATFDALPLTPEVRRALDELGWLHPTPVQLAAYEPVCRGNDLVVQARTGTGKTAGFGLPLVDRRVRPEPGTQALVLAPTRELALQSARELERIGRHRGIRTAAVYGGAPMERQVRELAAGAQIVSGTPGRVLDHLRRGSLDANSLGILVLDEADEMLSMGFAKELHAIVEMLPKSRQTLLFSATLDEQIQTLAQKYLKDPVPISLSSDAVGAQTIQHFVYLVSGLGKGRDLIRILEVEDPESAILFCNTKAATEQIAGELQAAGLNADWLNGDLAQTDRERVLERTRKGELRYLVATDVAARGIDISHLTHVINVDLPEALESYVHRTGRTGRAGRTGTAVSLITPQDLGQLYYLRLQYKIFPTERVLPSEGELKTRAELDRIEMIRAAFAERGATSNTLRALARRVLTHDDAEAIVAGLVSAFLGAHGTEAEVEEQASAARRARPARAVEAAAPEAGEGEEPRRRRRERREEEPAPKTDDSPRERPRREARRREEPRREPRAEEPRREPRAEEPRREPRALERAVEARPADEARSEAPSEPRREAEEGFLTLFVNVGRRDGFAVGDLLRLFDEAAGLSKNTLGRIRIRDRHSFVALPEEAAAHAVSSLHGRKVGEKDLVVEIARERPERSDAPLESP